MGITLPAALGPSHVEPELDRIAVVFMLAE